MCFTWYRNSLSGSLCKCSSILFWSTELLGCPCRVQGLWLLSCVWPDVQLTLRDKYSNTVLNLNSKFVICIKSKQQSTHANQNHIFLLIFVYLATGRKRRCLFSLCVRCISCQKLSNQLIFLVYTLYCVFGSWIKSVIIICWNKNKRD